MSTALAIETELGGERAAALLGSMAARIRAARGILITAHVHPDGDAIGSELALALALRRLGKAVRVVNDHTSPDKYRFLEENIAIDVLSGAPPAEAYPELELGILLDTSEPSRAGRLEKCFFAPSRRRICLDHHPGPLNPAFLDHWVAEAAPASGCLVLRLLDALGAPLDREIALPLLVALSTDTGWFRFANTTPLALRDAARLIATGIEVEPLYQRIFEDFSPRRVQLMGEFLGTLRLELGGRFVWSLIDHTSLRRSGLPYEELDGLSGELKTVRGAEVTATLVEVDPGRYKVSLRARGRKPVNGIAMAFHGGGHRKAAGFVFEGDLEALLSALRRRVEEELGRS